jgi:AcrR family transcriptional regulator
MKDDPKQRILDAGTRVFARKGYSGTGVREIAAEAGVNLAMVSYYFGGKSGLLEAILSGFFEKVGVTVKAVTNETGPPEELLRKLIHTMLRMVRGNTETFRVVLTEFPLELPHIVSHKADHLRTLILPMMKQILDSLGKRMRKPPRIEMFGPLVGSVIMFHFLLRPVLQQVFPVKFDDKFYQEFGDDFTDLLLYGLIGQRPEPNSAEEQKESD